MRTPSSRTSRISGLSPTGGYGSSSDIDGGNFEGPSDISDVAGLDGEIGGSRGTPPRRPPMGGIDLGKGLDLEKPRPPRAGIGFEVAKSPQGNVGIGVEIPLPVAAPISGRAGVSIDPATGQIRGGYGGLGIGKGPIGASVDVGVDTPPGGGLGCFKYATFTVGPFSHTVGKNECEPKEQEKNPQAPGGTGLSPGALSPQQIDGVMLTTSCGRVCVLLHNHFETDYENPYVTGTENICFKPRPVIDPETDIPTGEMIAGWDSEYINEIYYVEDVKYSLSKWDESFKENSIGTSWDYYTVDPLTRSQCFPEAPSPPASPPSSFSPPLPNPPPKKKMDDKCCKALMLMMLMQHKHLGVTPIPGMEQLDAFAGIKAKGEKFQTEEMAFPFEVPKVWLDPTAEPRDRLLVRNVSELLFVMASQSERLEHVLGTKEFLKDREGQLRGSETGVLNWLTSRITGISGNDFSYPDPNDFWFNTDDGIINEKKVEVRSVADAIRYLVESQNRLERILPVAEIKNSTIPARWVYPGKKGQLRVGNLIHLVEYMFRADDRARGFWPQTIKIKDANPAIKGDQKIELKFESQADMLREILKFLIDTEGDGDISNNFALRSAIQNCQQHQLLVQNNAMLDAIVEYMDFKIDRTKTKVPMPFSPFAGHQPNLFDQLLTKLGFGNKQIPGSIDKNTEEAVEALFEGVLQNTEVEVPIIKANEKKSMNEAFIEILKHASAASAAVSERVGEGALKRLVDSAGIAQAVSRFLLKRDIAESNGVGDLDQWINSAEAGYTDKPESSSLRFPESDPLEPYDRPIVENPRIREIDTKDPKAD